MQLINEAQEHIQIVMTIEECNDVLQAKFEIYSMSSSGDDIKLSNKKATFTKRIKQKSEA